MEIINDLSDKKFDRSLDSADKIWKNIYKISYNLFSLNIMKNTIIKIAVVHAILTAVYIVVVASFFFYVLKFFGHDGKPDTVLAPIAMLSLFVFSAAFTGTLIFGRPILWYLDGKKSEAVSLLAHTLAIFFVIMIIAFLALYFIS